MPASLIKKTEKFLYHKGFRDETLRRVMMAQFALLAGALAAGIGALYWTAWFIFFFVGSALIACNFWTLSRFLFKRFSGSYSKQLLVGQLLGFFGRLTLTGAILAACMLAGASPVPLSLGLVSCILVIGMTVLVRHMGRK